MPDVRVTHDSLSSDDAATPPKREVIPVGTYVALIQDVKPGSTQGTPPLAKITVEFNILHDENGDDKLQGRRVFQDFILEKESNRESLNQARRYELRQLLDATETPYTDEGFNTDHMLNRTVVITVRHRKGKPRNAEEEKDPPIFTNVTKIDTAEEVTDDDIL